MCDPGESPPDAARRELLEETGHAAREIVELGWVHPNPAIQSNRCYTFLARGAHRVGDPVPDTNESFEEVLVPLDEIPAWIGTGRITHALVVAAFQLLTASGLSE
jgi:8-oxo-dGTP pyrophosphatase MutT (NUDIX family)